MKLYHTETQVDYDTLMIELEEKGYKWLSGHKPTEYNYWERSKEDSCVIISSKYITFMNIEQSKKQHSNIPIIEYKAKGDKQMLNTECKQCHKKWHQDSAKYCSWCGKKLVSEPEFKSGDVVASHVFSDGSFSLVRLNEDLTNYLTSVDGFWYTERDCDITKVSLGVFKKDTRHATPEEIAEYEVALTFHKHGRNPFELKWGDLIKDGNSNRGVVVNPYIYIKEMFYKSGYELLATVEEVDEWLGADDE